MINFSMVNTIAHLLGPVIDKIDTDARISQVNGVLTIMLPQHDAEYKITVELTKEVSENKVVRTAHNEMTRLIELYDKDNKESFVRSAEVIEQLLSELGVFLESPIKGSFYVIQKSEDAPMGYRIVRYPSKSEYLKYMNLSEKDNKDNSGLSDGTTKS